MPNQTGLFYYGAGQTQTPFGNGFRCVDGAEVFRLPIEQATSNTLVHLVDFSDPPAASGQITTGSTWNFQAWFRDPAAGGAGFDLSDGIAVTTCP